MNGLFADPLTDFGECSRGQHSWQTTARPGVSVCDTCGIESYCPSCTLVPPGLPMRLCRFHRHLGFRLHDSQCPLVGGFRQ
jgi:hypothetical protein